MDAMAVVSVSVGVGVGVGVGVDVGVDVAVFDADAEGGGVVVVVIIVDLVVLALFESLGLGFGFGVFESEVVAAAFGEAVDDFAGVGDCFDELNEGVAADVVAFAADDVVVENFDGFGGVEGEGCVVVDVVADVVFGIVVVVVGLDTFAGGCGEECDDCF